MRAPYPVSFGSLHIVGSYQGENVRSRPISETKHLWACSVLRWGTTRESQVTNVLPQASMIPIGFVSLQPIGFVSLQPIGFVSPPAGFVALGSYPSCPHWVRLPSPGTGFVSLQPALGSYPSSLLWVRIPSPGIRFDTPCKFID